MRVLSEIILIILVISFIVLASIFVAREKILNYENPAVAEEPVFASRLSVLAFGDLMLDRNVYLKTLAVHNFNYPFLKIDPFLKEADIRMANLEGPITNFESEAIKNNRMKFTFSPKFLNALKKRFEVFNLANNHMMDFGESGYSQTRKFLRDEGIKYFGDFKNRLENISTIIDENGIKIGFIGYNDLDFKNLDEVLKEIQNLKTKTDFVAVFVHSGREYQTKESSDQQETARAFIDNGADLVLGSHPHVIQSIETYKDKPIFYSLGNFVFDQYFSLETMEGLAAQFMLEKSEGGIKFSYTPYRFKININSQPELKQ